MKLKQTPMPSKCGQVRHPRWHEVQMKPEREKDQCIRQVLSLERNAKRVIDGVSEDSNCDEVMHASRGGPGGE